MSSLLTFSRRRRFALTGVALLGSALSIWPAGSHANAQNQEAALLEVGKTIQRELTPEQKHVYRITVAANQYLSVRVEQQGLDVALVLAAPGGQQMLELDSPNGRNGPEEIQAALTDAGEYTLEVRANEKGAPAGRYTATLTAVRDATADDFKSFRATRDFIEARQLIQKRGAVSVRLALTKLAEAEQLRVELGDKRGQIEATIHTGIAYHFSTTLSLPTLM